MSLDPNGGDKGGLAVIALAALALDSVLICLAIGIDRGRRLARVSMEAGSLLVLADGGEGGSAGRFFPTCSGE